MITLIKFIIVRYNSSIFSKNSFWSDFKFFLSYELSKSLVRCSYYTWSKTQFTNSLYEKDYNDSIKELVLFERRYGLKSSGLIF